MQFHRLIEDGGHRRRTTTMGPHSRLLSIQQSANILCDKLVSLKLEKLSLFMFIRRSNAHRIVDASCLIVPGCNGCAADAEHQRQG